MASRSQNMHAANNTKRHRTPRIVRVVQDGTASLSVTFDRPMDKNFETFVIRTVDSVNGVVDWDAGSPGWSSDGRTYETDSSSVVDPSYTGPRFATYLSGDLRAKGRYPLLNYERCERVEDV